MEQETNKTKWVHVRLTEDDYDTLQKKFKKTDCRKFSAYIRNRLLDKQIVTHYRNQSADDALAELILLRTELSRIGNNFNQAVRKLNSMSPHENVQRWVAAYDNDRTVVVRKIEEVSANLQKFTDQWLQNFKQEHP
jgi:exonuclease VII large subunit